MKLKNKIALITGAGRGIGRSIAITFSNAGADVVLVARTREQLENVAAEIKQKGREALPIPCDVSSARAVQNLAQKVQESYGRIDILKEIMEKVVGRNLQQRVLEPEEVASMALYLATDDARGITGQAFNICGGRIFH